MSGQSDPGTVISYEYPGASARHYPVDDVNGDNRPLQQKYVDLFHDLPGPFRVLCRRLATYTYVNMDQAMRQGINAARAVIRELSRE